MLVVIPVCHKDEALVLKNLEWIAELDGKIDAPCVISCAEGFNSNAVAENATRIFKECLITKYSEWAGDPKWPQPQNWAWQSTARSSVFRTHPLPWLWWEADSTPVRKGWVDMIRCEYEQGKKPFMGCVTDPINGNQPHMNGVGVYPPNIAEYSTNAMLCRAAPFDIVIWPDIQGRTHYANHIIQHHCRVNGDSTHFPDHASVEEIVQPGVVLFHRCKDGSLIDRLREAKPKGLLNSLFSRKPVVAPKPKILPFIAHIDSSSGYGQFCSNIALELKRQGYAVQLYPPSMNEIHGKISPEIKQLIRPGPMPHDWAFVCFPAVVQPANLVVHASRIAQLTMWESTRLTAEAVKFMNRCKVVMNPSAWGVNCFSANGVDAPLRVVPLGLEMSRWPFKGQQFGRKECVFGTAGKTASGGIRKGFNVVVEAFRMAFPKEKDVRLRVKGFSEDPPVETHGDKRIDVVREYLDHDQFVSWLHSLDVFVSGSSSEGWGLIQQQAMRVGIPVIGIMYGAVCEFFTEDNGYPVAWTLVRGEGIYKDRGGGSYAKPDVEDMADKMRMAYGDKPLRHEKAQKAAGVASRFTLENSARQILKVLKEFKFIE